MKKNLRLMAALFIAMALFTSMASAEIDGGDMEVSAQASWIDSDGGDSWILIGQFGYFFGAHHFVSGALSLFDGFDSGVISGRYDYHINPQSKNIFYVGGQLGRSEFDFGTGSTAENTFGAQAGWKTAVGEKAFVKVEVNWFDAGDNGDTKQLFAGLGFRF